MNLRIRFLPIAIAVAAVVLGLRVGAFFLVSAPAQAQQPQPAPAAPPAAAPAPAQPQTPAQPQSPAQAQPSAPAPAAAAGAPDVTDLSGAEIEVLQQLASRRAEIDRRSADLDRREAVLKAAEERIDAKIQELKKLQGGVEQAISRYDEQESKRIDNLVKIYETMKPAEASRILEQLDLPTLVGITERMSTRKLAPVLAQMNPVRAKQLTTELSKRRKPGDAGGEAAAAPAPAAPGVPPAAGTLPPPFPPPAGG